MQNPFTAHQNYESKPKRNAFDNSHRCYMTGKLGCLYPVLTLEVNAGDSVQIDSEFLFNFFPFVFPVQTPLKASIYFFYGRNRIFWKNWMDFAYNNKQPSHPFILQPQGDFWKTGELADYLGVPTTYTSLAGEESAIVSRVPVSIPGVEHSPKSNRCFFGFPVKMLYGGAIADFLIIDDYTYPSSIYPVGDITYCLTWDFLYTADNIDTKLSLSSLPDDWNLTLNGHAHFLVYTISSDEMIDGQLFAISYSSSFDFTFFQTDSSDYADSRTSINLKAAMVDYVTYHPDVRFCVVLAMDQVAFQHLYPDLAESPGLVLEGMPAYKVSYEVGSSSSEDLSSLDSNPFAGTEGHAPAIPLNAIPFRFYEALYNAYFRNERNDPFIVNGEIEYNKWNTTLEDGADSTPYKLYYRNWEADFLTTATQTPQQGLAPLVGINVRGDMEFLNEDGTISRIRPTIADDGHTITGVAGVVENGTKEALRSAMELITSGISINDFRQVSSLQSWLENNLRKGLKYKDQVAANTGVKIRFDELDMPEFIGGFSRPVTMTSITQATPSTAQDNALGDRAGQASVYGGSKHKISHYCDEAGYIMAVMCVYPTPVYTQLLPKYFLKSDALSYYHPQFGSIGLQPISYREVCPVQVFQESGDLDATFGYQRPWYDLIANVDQAHGAMRTSLKRFLMHRTFAGIPQLGRDFLKIDPAQLNDVFTITDPTEDVFQGQVSFNIYTKRAIPRFGIPRQI